MFKHSEDNSIVELRKMSGIAASTEKECQTLQAKAQAIARKMQNNEPDESRPKKIGVRNAIRAGYKFGTDGSGLKSFKPSTAAVHLRVATFFTHCTRRLVMFVGSLETTLRWLGSNVGPLASLAFGSLGSRPSFEPNHPSVFPARPPVGCPLRGPPGRYAYLT